VKVLFQASVKRFSFKNVTEEVMRIAREEGIKAFWKGNSAQMLRIIPYSAIVRTT